MTDTYLDQLRKEQARLSSRRIGLTKSLKSNANATNGFGAISFVAGLIPGLSLPGILVVGASYAVPGIAISVRSDELFTELADVNRALELIATKISKARGYQALKRVLEVAKHPETKEAVQREILSRHVDEVVREATNNMAEQVKPEAPIIDHVEHSDTKTG